MGVILSPNGIFGWYSPTYIKHTGTSFHDIIGNLGEILENVLHVFSLK
jgi:hypothetical protein